MMDSYVIGGVLYRAYMDKKQGVYTIEFKVKNIYRDYLKITTEWDFHLRTRVSEREYTERISYITKHFAPTPIEALEKLKGQKQCEQEEQAGLVEATKGEIMVINMVMEDAPLEV